MPKLSLHRLRKRVRRTYTGARNAVRLVRGNRFTAPYETPYELALRVDFLRLRHYAQQPQSTKDAPTPICADPILLVPPLMVTSQVYDISPPLSVVKFLRDQGLDVWLADFGTPEAETGGMARTLDDHIHALDRSITHIATTTGRNVHLAGYSQGGMFVYQVAAYRGCKNILSLVTFGSPVDLQKNTPTPINRGLMANVTGVVRSVADGALNALPGIPGMFSSLGFKLMSPAQEIKYLRMMLGILDDREALERLEPMRRFLGGEGFVAWPGPAFRSFVDDMIVHNRMMNGGFVIGGKTLSLAAIDVPVLCVYGARDQFAQPRAVRAIARVVGEPAPVLEQVVDAGHFGLVVGSRALREVWPNVARWMLWHADRGPMPVDFVTAKPAGASATRPTAAPVPKRDDSLDTLAQHLLDGVWDQAGVTMRDVTQSARWLRWQ
ncbi:MAG: alpha/beta fold hydrolase, partial [Nannocystaceae bacterium]